MNVISTLKSGTTLVFLLFSLSLTAQEQRKGHYIGLSNAAAAIAKLTLPGVVGAGGYYGKSTSKFGINYTYQWSKRLALETGLTYYDHDYETSYTSSTGSNQRFPNNFTMLNLPVGIKMSFGNYVYLNGGLNLDIELSSTSANKFSGIGAMLGVGGQYFYKNKIGVFVNPQVLLHSLASFSEYNSRELAEASLTFGLAYKLK